MSETGTRLIIVAAVSPSARDLALCAARGTGTDVIEAPTELALLRLVFERKPDIVVLDIDRPEGLELVETLRAASDVPLIVLTESTPDASARALDLGADDVAYHDTHPIELRARVRAVLRRRGQFAAPSPEAVIRTGALEIDRRAREVRKAGKPIRLTRKEYQVLDVLAARIGELTPHPILLQAVRGEDSAQDTHYLRMYVGYLRSKLEDDPSHPRYLVNEWGVGYRLAQLPLEAEGEQGGRSRSDRGARGSSRRPPD